MQPFLPLILQNNYTNLNYAPSQMQANLMCASMNTPSQNAAVLDYIQYLNFLYCKYTETQSVQQINQIGEMLNRDTNRNCNAITSLDSISSNGYGDSNYFKDENGTQYLFALKQESSSLSSTGNVNLNGNSNTQAFCIKKRKQRQETVIKAKIEKEKKKDANVVCLSFAKKKKKFVNRNRNCPHKSAKHYAKNMCSTCYHAKGREKKAWNCSHVEESHYALGLCQDCYQTNYANVRKDKGKEELN